MLPKSSRLTSAEVPAVLKEGRGASFGPVRVKYLKREGKGSVSRFAVVISKKVLKGAVDRNRARRRVYTVARAIKSPYPIDAVILLSSGTLSPDELRANVKEALLKVR